MHIIKLTPGITIIFTRFSLCCVKLYIKIFKSVVVRKKNPSKPHITAKYVSIIIAGVAAAVAAAVVRYRVVIFTKKFVREKKKKNRH